MLKFKKYTGGFTATNGYALDAPDGWIIVDAPEHMLGWIKGHEIVPAALMLTHMHFDHVMDAAAIAIEFGVPVYAFAPLSRDLTLEDLLGAFAGSNFEVKPFEVNHFLEGENIANVCGLDFHLLHVPGHSPDSLCFQLLEEKVIFGGDVLMRHGIGRSDFHHGDEGLLLRGIREKLYTLDDEIEVFPGHGEKTTIGEEKAQNPHVRPV
jgi:hydroxyacylglutathione hydrolase